MNIIRVGDYIYKRIRLAQDYSQRDLSDFLTAYMEAALWTGTAWGVVEEEDEYGDLGEEGDVPMDEVFDISDIDPACEEKMTDDCMSFLSIHGADINALEEGSIGRGYSNMEMAGHDFWLTRNGHGEGFWDGDWPEPLGTEMTETSKKFGRTDVDGSASGEGGVSC